MFEIYSKISKIFEYIRTHMYNYKNKKIYIYNVYFFYNW